MTLNKLLRDFEYERVIEFLDTHYIDTEYYLSDEARELMNKDILHIEYIDNLPAPEMIYWLDINKLIIEEQI